MSFSPPPPRVTRSRAKKHTEDKVDSLENSRGMSVGTDADGNISAIQVTLDTDNTDSLGHIDLSESHDETHLDEQLSCKVECDSISNE